MRGVERAGGRALLVPPTGVGVEETLDALDGIVFSGGADIDPARYGQEPEPATSGIERFRDDYEFALLERALERDLPVLGICRGSQVLNVGLGGDLVQHLPDVSDETHKDVPGDFADHEVDVERGTRVGDLLGSRAPVKSHHHQGFGRLGEGLVISARADDGTVEAVEDPERRFAVGVLWHPEAGEDGGPVPGARRRGEGVPRRPRRRPGLSPGRGRTGRVPSGRVPVPGTWTRPEGPLRPERARHGADRGAC